MKLVLRGDNDTVLPFSTYKRFKFETGLAGSEGSVLSATRRDELIEMLNGQIRAWNLREPAIALLAMHEPLAFLASQMLVAAQPFLGVWAGNRLAQDLALFFQDPQNVAHLIARLEQNPAPSHEQRERHAASN